MLSFKQFLVEDFTQEELPTLISAIKELSGKNVSTASLLAHLGEKHGFEVKKFGEGQSAVVYAGTRYCVPRLFGIL